MPEPNRRTDGAGKFSARLPNDLHGSFSAQADRSQRSLNSEVRYAIDQWANQDSTIRIFHRLLCASSRTQEPSDFRVDGVLEVKLMCRLSVAQREALKHHSKALGIPMNALLLQIMAWWIRISAEIEELKTEWAACHLHQAD